MRPEDKNFTNYNCVHTEGPNRSGLQKQKILEIHNCISMQKKYSVILYFDALSKPTTGKQPKSNENDNPILFISVLTAKQHLDVD